MAATNALAHLALFGANAILGAGSVVSKLGLAGCNPVMFALLREMLAAPLLFLLSLCAKGSGSAGSRSRDSDQIGCDRRGFDRIDALQFFVAGLMLFGTNLGYIIGVKLLGATTAAIWQSALPIFTMLIAVLVGYERLTMLKALGVLAAFTGCAFVSLYHPMSEGGASDDAPDAGVWHEPDDAEGEFDCGQCDGCVRYCARCGAPCCDACDPTGCTA